MTTRSGLLNLLKPPGMTSHDAVAVVRRLFGERRVGHAGTLDPDAAGVLVVCVGEATKAVQFMEEHRKEYVAEAVLGVDTDTLDAGGSVVRTAREGWATTGSEIKRAAAALTGEILQVPPMVSAVHHGGRRLYELARAGIEVQREARPVTIHQFEIVSVGTEPAREPVLAGTVIRARVLCSKGTYIRSLVADLGCAVGGGAHLSFLVRTASGPFTLEKSVTFEELDAMSMEERHASLLPADQGLVHLRAVCLEEDEQVRFRNGRAVTLEEGRAPGLSDDERVRVYGESLEFLGIGAWRNGALAPVRGFVSSESSLAAGRT